MKLSHPFVLSSDDRKIYLQHVVQNGETLEIESKYGKSPCWIAFKRSDAEYRIRLTFDRWRGLGSSHCELVVSTGDGKWSGSSGTIYRGLVDKTLSDLYRGFEGLENYTIQGPNLLTDPARLAMIDRIVKDRVFEGRLSVNGQSNGYVLTIADRDVGFFRCEINSDGAYVDDGIAFFHDHEKRLVPVPRVEVVALRIKIDDFLVTLAERPEGADR